MNGQIFYSAGHTDALEQACNLLRQRGCIFSDKPDSRVTHLLLPAPAFSPGGDLKGNAPLSPVLDALSNEVTVVGGNLAHPLLAGYKTLDLLQDPLYLAENAAITAHCAIPLLTKQLSRTLADTHLLVIGWGRIGKCLARLLAANGARVTVAARKPEDLAILAALGYDILDSRDLGYSLARFHGIFNTVPSPVITEEASQYCQPDCIKIDLASTKGIFGSDVLWARGLPGQYAPVSSGALMARTILRLIQTP